MPKFRRKKTRMQLHLQQKQQRSYIFVALMAMSFLGAIPLGLWGYWTEGNMGNLILLAIGLIIGLGCLQSFRNAHKKYLNAIAEEIQQRPKQILIQWEKSKGKQQVIITSKGILWMPKAFLDFQYLKAINLVKDARWQLTFTFTLPDEPSSQYTQRFVVPTAYQQKIEEVLDLIHQEHLKD